MTTGASACPCFGSCVVMVGQLVLWWRLLRLTGPWLVGLPGLAALWAVICCDGWLLLLGCCGSLGRA